MSAGLQMDGYLPIAGPMSLDSVLHQQKNRRLQRKQQVSWYALRDSPTGLLVRSQRIYPAAPMVHTTVIREKIKNNTT